MSRSIPVFEYPLYASALALIAFSAGAEPLEFRSQATSLTVEAYANVTAGFGSGEEAGGSRNDVRLDGALRLLARQDFATGPDIGARVVVSTSPEDAVDLAEASVLVFGRSGRLEAGRRQGLPDVLVGYAPNNFTFTSAEFGPASGPSLDPGGGLQPYFLDPALAAQVAPLSSLGFTATLAGDESAKVLYVSPKRNGYLAGVSYAPNATDRRFGDLAQFGLTHDTYWDDNVLHVGGSYTYARGRHDAAGNAVGDLNSVNLGATVVVHDDLQLGISATFDGASGRTASVGHAMSADTAGVVASANFNRGPWTVGAYAQWARGEGDATVPGNDVLRAAEAGISYRTSTQLRIYAAYYRYDLDDEGARAPYRNHTGGVLLLGLRASL